WDDGPDRSMTPQHGGKMDKRQLEALVKKNAAKAASATSTRKGFGKKYDVNLADDPIDEASLKERERGSARAGRKYRERTTVAMMPTAGTLRRFHELRDSRS